MRSKRSFFNTKIFTKTICRFWPIWVIYTLIWMVMPISMGALVKYWAGGDLTQTEVALRIRRELLESCGLLSVALTAVFAVLSAMAVWSFMYSSRSANGVASLPVRRESVFLSAFAAGIVPVIAANLLIAGAFGAAAMSGGLRVFDPGALAQWFAIVSLQYIFYYCFATFCAQLTGNILVLPVLYAVLNFTVIVVESLVKALCSLFVYGLNARSIKLGFLSPPYFMVAPNWVDIQWYDDGGGLESVGFTTGWGMLCAYAGVGIVLAGLALLLYRRRRMESAGDVVAIEVLKPIFRCCMTFGTALVTGGVLYWLIWGNNGADPGQRVLVWSLALFMLLGAFVGHFVAEMLIKKSFRVFKNGWVSLGICALVILAMVISCENDLFGYERRVPAPERVESVQVLTAGEAMTLKEENNIAAVTQLHRAIVDYKDLNENSLIAAAYSRSYYVNIYYSLKNGRLMQRTYDLRLCPEIAESMALTRELEAVVNCQEAIIERKSVDLEVSPEAISYTNIYGAMYAPDCARIEGYDNVEDYLLIGCAGVSEEVLERMGNDEYRALLADTIINNAVNWRRFADAAGTEINGIYYSVDPDEVDYDELIINYKWDFSREEICELYYDCILPDIADGSLGRIWLLGDLDGDYLDSAYSFRLSFEVTGREPDGSKHQWDEFYTVPTVDSRRTVEWLTAHGVSLLTEREAQTDYQYDVPSAAVGKYG